MENHKIICQEKCTLGLILNSEEKMHTQICLKLGFGSSIWLGFMGRITFNGWVILIIFTFYFYKDVKFQVQKASIGPMPLQLQLQKAWNGPMALQVRGLIETTTVGSKLIGNQLFFPF